MTRRYIYILFDRKIENSLTSFLYPKLKELYNDVFMIDNPDDDASIKSWFKVSFKTLLMSKKNDIIICSFDFQAVIVYWLSLFLFQKRKIIAINIMLKDKPTMKNKFASFLYKKALKSKRFKATVATKEFADLCCDKLKIDNNMIILRDVFIDFLREEKCRDNVRSVFVGGSNGRDWETAFAVAEKMKDVSFTFVLTPGDYEKYISKNHTNVKLYKSVSFNEFIQLQKESSIAYLPLLTEAPSGLLVMFQAAQLRQMVITSDTCTTRGYIINNHSGALIPLFSVDEAIKTICYYLDNVDKRNFCCDNFLSFLKSECNQDKFTETVTKVIESFSK